MIRQPHPGEICLLLSLGFKVIFHKPGDTCCSLFGRSLTYHHILVFDLFAEGIAGAPDRMNQALPKWEVDLRT